MQGAVALGACLVLWATPWGAEAHVNPSALPSQKPLGMVRRADYTGPHAYFDTCAPMPGSTPAANQSDWDLKGLGRVFTDREASAGGVRVRISRNGATLPEGVVVTAHVHARPCGHRDGPGAHWMFDSSECGEGLGADDPCYNVAANEMHFTGATDHHGVLDSATSRRFDATGGTRENPVDGTQDARGHSVVLHGPNMTFMACCDLTWVDPGPACAVAQDCPGQGSRCTRAGTCCTKPGGACEEDSQCCGSPRRRCGGEGTCCGGAHARCKSDGDCCGNATCSADRGRCALALGSACDVMDPSKHQCAAPGVCHEGMCVDGEDAEAGAPEECGAQGDACATLDDCCRGRKTLRDASRLRCLHNPRIPIPGKPLEGTCEWLARCNRAGLSCASSEECCGDTSCALHPERDARVCCTIETGLPCTMPDGPAAAVPGVDSCCWPNHCVAHAPNAPRGTCQPSCANTGEACSTRPCCTGSCTPQGVCAPLHQVDQGLE